jgi:hypothetical protein
MINDQAIIRVERAENPSYEFWLYQGMTHIHPTNPVEFTHVWHELKPTSGSDHIYVGMTQGEDKYGFEFGWKAGKPYIRMWDRSIPNSRGYLGEIDLKTYATFQGLVELGK